MMPLTELAMSVVLCGAAGCTEPTAPPPPPPPNVTVTSSGECVRVQFQIHNATDVTGTYPGASCPTVGLIVAKPGNTTWVGATRTLTIPVMVRNTTAEVIQLPLRLERQAAVNLIGGTVVSGYRPSSGGEGYYGVLLEDDGTGVHVNAAIAALRALPQVLQATRTGRVRT
jgi:hypothetical protein